MVPGPRPKTIAAPAAARPAVAILLAMLTLLAGPRAQTDATAPAFPSADDPPAGVVLDEDLQPVAGASVRLVAAATEGRPFGRAIAQVLRRTPLPATRTGRDGSFVLPLTERQRALHVVENGYLWHEHTQFWLVVEHGDHLPWREPILGGLDGYLGTRAVLRKRRAGDDPYADLPWPPADPGLAYPWLPLGDGDEVGFAADRRGIPAADQTTRATGTYRVRVAVIGADGRPAPGAAVMCSDSCYTSPDDELPLESDADGFVEFTTPAGEHRMSILAPRCMPAVIDWVTRAADGVTEVTADLTPGDTVDVVAVDDRGRHVPFVRLDVVSYDFHREDRPSKAVMSDSLGRARVRVPGRREYFAYADIPGDGRRVAFEDDGVVRVTMLRPVTVVVTADALPTRGQLRWESPLGEIFQTFTTADNSAPRIATRVFSRGMQTATIGGGGRLPIAIRADDLPPAPAEPLLDLAVLDRTSRKRADLDLVPPAGRRALRFSIRPPWQGRDEVAEAIRYSRRVGEAGRWELWSRDDRAIDAVATAAGCADTPVQVPAREAGAPLPTIEVRLEAERD